MPTPFLIYGWVFNTTDQPLLNPNVTVKNLNTSEEYTVETNASSNYYQVIISSCNVGEGDVLYFNVSDDGNSTNRTVTVTLQNMTEGGLFEQNLSLYQAPPGKCGDAADEDGYITVYDAKQVWRVAGHVIPPSALANEWAADVDCDGFITVYDAKQIWRVAGHVIPESDLHCCS